MSKSRTLNAAKQDRPPRDPQPGPMLRVGMVTTSFPVAHWASSGIFVQRLAASLPANVETEVLIPCPDTALTDEPQARYRLHCFAYGPRPWLRLAHHPGGIPDALRRRDPSLLLLPLFLPAMFAACLRLAGRVDLMHGNWSLPGLIAALAARIRGKPALITLRGEDVNRAQTSPLASRLLAASMCLNRYVVVVSEAMREQLTRDYPAHASRVRHIPNGVNLPAARPCNGFRQPLRLVTVGSLIRRKRLDLMLHALAHPEAPPDVLLHIVGDGPERERLAALIDDLGLRDRVVLVGGVEPSSVAEHLRWADLFLFTSESEGRPNVLLEAMAAGLPIVALDIPGVAELLAEGRGWCIPNHGPGDLAPVLARVAADAREAARRGAAARRWIIDSGLSWQTAAARYADLYAQCLAPARAPGDA